MKKEIKFKTEFVKTKYGWSRWINSIQKGYLMKCCDCGLIHELEFRTYFETKWGKKKLGTLLDKKQFKAEFRARRKK